MLLLGLLLLLAEPVPAAAPTALRFDFVTESTGDPLKPRQSGSVVIAGQRTRVDYDEGGTDRTTVLSVDGGKTEVALNASRKTHFVPKKRLSEQLDSRFFTIPVAGTTSARVKVKEVRLADPPPLVSGSDRSYELRLSYVADVDFHGTPVRVLYDVQMELWTNTKYDVAYVPGDPRTFHTGEATVDDAVQKILDAVEGFPVRRRLAVTRTVEGGASYSDVVTTTNENVRTVSVSLGSFEVPTGYQYEDPVWSGAGT